MKNAKFKMKNAFIGWRRKMKNEEKREEGDCGMEDGGLMRRIWERTGKANSVLYAFPYKTEFGLKVGGKYANSRSVGLGLFSIEKRPKLLSFLKQKLTKGFRFDKIEAVSEAVAHRLTRGHCGRHAHGYNHD